MGSPFNKIFRGSGQSLTGWQNPLDEGELSSSHQGGLPSSSESSEEQGGALLQQGRRLLTNLGQASHGLATRFFATSKDYLEWSQQANQHQTRESQERALFFRESVSERIGQAKQLSEKQDWEGVEALLSWVDSCYEQFFQSGVRGDAFLLVEIALLRARSAGERNSLTESMVFVDLADLVLNIVRENFEQPSGQEDLSTMLLEAQVFDLKGAEAEALSIYEQAAESDPRNQVLLEGYRKKLSVRLLQLDILRANTDNSLESIAYLQESIRLHQALGHQQIAEELIQYELPELELLAAQSALWPEIDRLVAAGFLNEQALRESPHKNVEVFPGQTKAYLSDFFSWSEDQGEILIAPNEKFLQKTPEQQLKLLQTLQQVAAPAEMRHLIQQHSDEPEALYWEAQLALLEGNPAQAQLKFLEFRNVAQGQPHLEAKVEEARQQLRAHGMRYLFYLAESNQTLAQERSMHFEFQRTARQFDKENTRYLQGVFQILSSGQADTIVEAREIFAQQELKLEQQAKAENRLTSSMFLLHRGTPLEPRSAESQARLLDDAEFRQLLREHPSHMRLSKPDAFPGLEWIRLAGGTLQVDGMEPLRIVIGPEGGNLQVGQRIYAFPPSDKIRVVRYSQGQVQHDHLNLGTDYRMHTSVDKPANYTDGVKSIDPEMELLLETQTPASWERMKEQSGQDQALLELAGALHHRHGSYALARDLWMQVLATDMERAKQVVGPRDLAWIRQRNFREFEQRYIRQRVHRGLEEQQKMDPEGFAEAFSEGWPTAAEFSAMVEEATEQEIEKETLYALCQKLDGFSETDFSSPEAYQAWRQYRESKDPFSELANVSAEGRDMIVDEVVMTAVSAPISFGVGSLVFNGVSKLKTIRRLATLERLGGSNLAIGASTLARVTAESALDTGIQGLLLHGQLMNTGDSSERFVWNMIYNTAFHGGNLLGGKVADRLGAGEELIAAAAQRGEKTFGMRAQRMFWQSSVMVGMATAGSYAHEDPLEMTFGERVLANAVRMPGNQILLGVVNRVTGRCLLRNEAAARASLEAVAREYHRGIRSGLSPAESFGHAMAAATTTAKYLSSIDPVQGGQVTSKATPATMDPESIANVASRLGIDVEDEHGAAVLTYLLDPVGSAFALNHLVGILGNTQSSRRAYDANLYLAKHQIPLEVELELGAVRWSITDPARTVYDGRLPADEFVVLSEESIVGDIDSSVGKPIKAPQGDSPQRVVRKIEDEGRDQDTVVERIDEPTIVSPVTESVVGVSGSVASAATSSPSNTASPKPIPMPLRKALWEATVLDPLARVSAAENSLVVDGYLKGAERAQWDKYLDTVREVHPQRYLEILKYLNDSDSDYYGELYQSEKPIIEAWIRDNPTWTSDFDGRSYLQQWWKAHYETDPGIQLVAEYRALARLLDPEQYLHQLESEIPQIKGAHDKSSSEYKRYARERASLEERGARLVDGDSLDNFCRGLEERARLDYLAEVRKFAPDLYQAEAARLNVEFSRPLDVASSDPTQDRGPLPSIAFPNEKFHPVQLQDLQEGPIADLFRDPKYRANEIQARQRLDEEMKAAQATGATQDELQSIQSRGDEAINRAKVLDFSEHDGMRPLAKQYAIPWEYFSRYTEGIFVLQVEGEARGQMLREQIGKGLGGVTLWPIARAQDLWATVTHVRTYSRVVRYSGETRPSQREQERKIQQIFDEEKGRGRLVNLDSVQIKYDDQYKRYTVVYEAGIKTNQALVAIRVTPLEWDPQAGQGILRDFQEDTMPQLNEWVRENSMRGSYAFRVLQTVAENEPIISRWQAGETLSPLETEQLATVMLYLQEANQQARGYAVPAFTAGDLQLLQTHLGFEPELTAMLADPSGPRYASGLIQGITRLHRHKVNPPAENHSDFIDGWVVRFTEALRVQIDLQTVGDPEKRASSHDRLDNSLAKLGRELDGRRSSSNIVAANKANIGDYGADATPRVDATRFTPEEIQALQQLGIDTVALSDAPGGSSYLTGVAQGLSTLVRSEGKDSSAVEALVVSLTGALRASIEMRPGWSPERRVSAKQKLARALEKVGRSSSGQLVVSGQVVPGVRISGETNGADYAGFAVSQQGVRGDLRDFNFDRRSWVGEVEGLTHGHERAFDQGAYVQQGSDGRWILFEPTSGANTTKARVLSAEEGPKVAAAYRGWQERASFPEVSTQQLHDAALELMDWGQSHQIALTFGENRTPLTMDTAVQLGAALPYLNVLLRTFPESLWASQPLQEIHLGAPHHGAGHGSSFDASQKTLMLFDGAFRGSRRNFLGLVLHEIGHGLAMPYLAETGGVIPPAVRQNMLQDYQTLVRQGALVAVDFREGVSARIQQQTPSSSRTQQDAYPEFLADLALLYVAGGEKLRNHIQALPPQSSQRQAWERIYAQMKNQVFGGQEYGILSFAGVNRPQNPRSGSIEVPGTPGMYGPSAALTHPGIGYKRGKPTAGNNEDAIVQGVDGRGRPFVVVLDGIGGAKDGDQASGIGARVISQKMAAMASDEGLDASADWVVAFAKANLEIWQRNLEKGYGKLEMSGATAVGYRLVTQADGTIRAEVMQLGDSRAMLFRRNAQGEYELIEISQDHSPVMDEYRREPDLFSEDPLERELEMRVHPQAHKIGIALGVQDDIMGYHFYSWELQPGDRLVLVSDGVSDGISTREMAQQLNGKTPTQARDAIAQETLKRMTVLDAVSSRFDQKEAPVGRMVNPVFADSEQVLAVSLSRPELRPTRRGEKWVDDRGAELQDVVFISRYGNVYNGKGQLIDHYKVDNMSIHVYGHDLF